MQWVELLISISWRVDPIPNLLAHYSLNIAFKLIILLRGQIPAYFHLLF